jgi:hypothetical protein
LTTSCKFLWNAQDGKTRFIIYIVGGVFWNCNLTFRFWSGLW